MDGSKVEECLDEIEKLKKGANPNERRREKQYEQHRNQRKEREEFEEEEVATSSEGGDDIEEFRKRLDLDPYFNTKYSFMDEINVKILNLPVNK